jgi:hypothetical protein
MIDATHWEKLGGMDPADVTRRSLADYDAQSGEYCLRILTEEVRISPSKRAVSWPAAAAAGRDRPGFHYWLVSVVYLISARAEALKGQWISPVSLPYGEFFFRGPHTLPTNLVADAFGDRPERFRRAAAELGGTACPALQGAFQMPALPRVPILVQLWERDEEFPARANFLMDGSAGDHLAVDAILALLTIVAKGLASLA